MTLPGAHETARNGAERFGNTWRVYRMPAWPDGVYTASALEPPALAHIAATYPLPGPKVVPAVAPRGDPQGSLF